MTNEAIDRVKSLIAMILEPKLSAAGLTADAFTDDLDLRDQGVLDSLGFVELLTALEVHLGTAVDLADLDAEHLTRVGALARHIAENGSRHVN